MSDVLTDSPEHLRLGIDMDGVIADFNGGWMRRYNRDFGTSLDPEQVTGWDRMHELTDFRDMAAFWAWARDGDRGLFRDLDPIPGAIETLRDLAREHRIAIITARFDWAIADTLAWLAEHQVLAREVHFVASKDAVTCDVYLDDAPHQLEALVRAHPGATVCRQVAAYNRPVSGTIDVRDWGEFRAVVDSVAAARSLVP